MLSTCDLIAFAATASPERAREFYESVLGLRFVSDEPHALVFDANGTMLRIQKVQALDVAPYTRLGWRVPDIARAMAELASRGVTFTRYEVLPQDEHGVWTTPDGAKIAWFTDPDGNTLSLTEWPA